MCSSVKIAKNRTHVWRQLGVKEHIFTCCWVDEADGLGMEGLPRDEFQQLLDLCFLSGCTRSGDEMSPVVSRVAKYRMVDVSKMNSNLVCAPGTESKPHKCKVLEPLDYCILSDRLL